MPYKDPIKNKEFIKKYKEKNREYLKTQAFENYLKRAYGLTISRYNNMKSEQNNKCYLCKLEKKLFVDHCHKSNNIRKLLCIKCNLYVGYYENSKHLFTQIGQYVENFK